MRDADEGEQPMEGIPAGLCERCRHVRVIENRRGSRFFRCELADVDARFPKYPRLPVLQCDGFAVTP